MPESDFRVRLWLLRRECAAECLARPGGVSIDEIPDHPLDVGLRSRKPVLQQQQVRAHILRRARDELENGWKGAERLHLPLAARLSLPARPTQLLEQRDRREHRACLACAHVELPEPRALHQLRRAERTEHGIRVGTARDHCVEHLFRVLVLKELRARDDVRSRDVRARAFGRRRIRAPVGGDVHAELESRQLLLEHGTRTLERLSQMRIKRHDHEAQRGRLSGHNTPWRRTTCRPRSRQCRDPSRIAPCCAELCRERKMESF